MGLEFNHLQDIRCRSRVGFGVVRVPRPLATATLEGRCGSVFPGTLKA